jgi:type IV secretory pathway VirJ component
MIRSWIAAVSIAWLASSAWAAAADDPAPTFKSGLLGAPHILLPAGNVNGTIFLFSDEGGWTNRDQAMAQALQQAGAIVVGVDTGQYLARLAADKADECVYLVSDIEDLSRQIQRSLGTGIYHSPVVAGIGVAGTLSLAISAQTPAATIGRTIAVDPGSILPLARPLCTDAPRQAEAGGTVYGLSKGGLADPVEVITTAGASAEGLAHVESLQQQGFPIELHSADAEASAALQARLLHGLAPRSEGQDPLADLKLIEMPATAAYDTMAIVYSGDGGWRDLDKKVAEALAKQGVPTVGLDSLRYFWSRKTPEQTSADLARILDAYAERWNVQHVILIGYSFGADVLPNAYNRLPPEAKARVAEIALLGPSEQVDYEISVGEFLGAAGSESRKTLPDLRQVQPGLIQCVYGEGEGDSACPALGGSGVELVKTSGGHHFDGDYEALAARILDGLKRRLASQGQAAR